MLQTVFEVPITCYEEQPAAVLRMLVKRIFVVESGVKHRDFHLPDIRFSAVFRFRGECWLGEDNRAPQNAITGLWDTVRTHVHSETHTAVMVALTALGARAFLRQPLDGFSNTTADLANILGSASRLAELHERLILATDHHQRIGLVQDMLLATTTDVRSDPQVAAAMTMIENTNAQPKPRIDQIAQQVGLSQSALERRFRRFVGASPREYGALVRLRHVIRLHTTGADLTTIAHKAGYFDQSHFIKDFKRFAGAAPEAFFRLANTR